MSEMELKLRTCIKTLRGKNAYKNSISLQDWDEINEIQTSSDQKGFKIKHEEFLREGTETTFTLLSNGNFKHYPFFKDQFIMDNRKTDAYMCT